MVRSEVTPSRNRGPGPIDDEEAGIVRNTLSNTQTSNKKFKVELSACEQLSFSHCEVTLHVGGPGILLAGYGGARTRYAPKKVEMSLEKNATLGRALGPARLQACEDFFLLNQPDYAVAPVNNKPNKNCTKSIFTPKQWAAKGLKSQLRGNLELSRGTRLADHGVSMINMFEQELKNQYMEEWVAAGSVGPAPRDPTDNEIQAAIQLAILFGWDNRNKAVGTRKEINNVLTDLTV